MRKGQLDICCCQIGSVISKASDRCDSIPVNRKKLACVCTSVSHNNNQNITLAGTVIFSYFLYLARIVDSGYQICFQISLRNIYLIFICNCFLCLNTAVLIL